MHSVTPDVRVLTDEVVQGRFRDAEIADRLLELPEWRASFAPAIYGRIFGFNGEICSIVQTGTHPWVYNSEAAIIFNQNVQKLNRAIEEIEEGGVRSLFQAIIGSLQAHLRPGWRSVRNFSPVIGYREFNGVRVDKKRVGDRLLAGIDDKPEHESPYADYIRDHVLPGESVVVIGGWYGVSAVAAVETTGPDGNVTVFEATRKGANRVRLTGMYNKVADRLTVHESAVGSVQCPKDFEQVNFNAVSVEDLPVCDVLAIDCDGCEFDVLENLAIRPRVIVVEHHGIRSTEMNDGFEYQRDRLEAVVNNLGYQIVESCTREAPSGAEKHRLGWFVLENTQSK